MYFYLNVFSFNIRACFSRNMHIYDDSMSSNALIIIHTYQLYNFKMLTWIFRVISSGGDLRYLVKVKRIL